MSFKDQIKQDLSDIFLNLDEFADLHRIEGKEVPVVIDSDIMAKLSKIGDNRIHGMDEADMVIMGKASDLPENLDPGRLLNLDGREVIVVTTTSEMGLVQIAVRQNRDLYESHFRRGSDNDHVGNGTRTDRGSPESHELRR